VGINRLIIVSNRLPVTVRRTNGGFDAEPSSGGLVSALFPIFKAAGECWVGWPGTGYDADIQETLRRKNAGYCFEPVFLTEAERSDFYHGCSNEILWPLFHDFPSRCNFDPAYWNAYCDATEKFADGVERVARRDDFVWVHDYHLMMLADALRARDLRLNLSYFHHVPFPAPDIFEKLPWRAEVIRGLLQFNHLGFQTDRDKKNFLWCARRLYPGARLQRIGARQLLSAGAMHTEVRTSPVSIDYQGLAREAEDSGVEGRVQELRQAFEGKQIILGLDRLDYTKGIPERLQGYRMLLENRPEFRGRVVLLQVAVPSRQEIPEYAELKVRIEQLVSEINGKYGQPGWSPVVYLHRSVPHCELLALYRAAHVALVTPLKDGMNLVAKEFCAARTDEKGVLVLSEFAGSAAELKEGAVLVNPFDLESISSALHRALSMPDSEQRVLMQAMREKIERHDLLEWFNSCCGQRSIKERRVVLQSALQPA
jgi:alpha,alpha-trehalose-phosphate synthase [UDP-forming]